MRMEVFENPSYVGPSPTKSWRSAYDIKGCRTVTYGVTPDVYATIR